MSPQTQDQAPPDALLEELGGTIDKLFKERIDGEIVTEKNWQYLRLRKCDLYNRGLQFLAPTVEGGYADWQPIGTQSNPAGNANGGSDRGLLDYNFDLVTAYRRKWVAVLGLRPFYNVKAIADDPESEVDRRAAKQANLCATWLRPIWNVRRRNLELFDREWRSGTVYVYLNYAADRSLFGEVSEPKFVEQQITLEPEGYRCPNCKLKSEGSRNEQLNGEQEAVDLLSCPQCGTPLADQNFEEAQTVPVPKQQGTQAYPGSGPVMEFYDGLYVTVPFDSPGDMGKVKLLVFEKEEDQGLLLQMFGESLRKKMGETASSDSMLTQQGVITRASVASLTATPRAMMANRWTYGRYWLTTAIFEYISDPDKRKALYENFPEGLKVHRVNDKTVKIENECLSEHWVAFVPEPGETMYNDPVCWPILGHQDMKNDIGNIGMALLERGLPAFLVDPDVINAEALSSKPYSPMEIYEANPGFGARLDSAVKMLPAATFPEHMMPFDQSVEANVQSILGLQPAVFGGGERQPTAEGQRTMLNQALMQLGVPGEYAQIGWAECHLKACKQIEKYAPRAFRVSAGDGSSDVVDPEVMRAGRYHFEAEPGLPMSWAEKRDQMTQIITQNPDLAHSMFLDAPINAGVIKDYVLSGMPELRSPDEDLRNYVMDRIQILTAEGQQPMPDPQGNPQSSVPLDEFIDPSLYAMVAKIEQEWLIEPAGLKVRDSNLMGYKNVIADAMANNQKGMPPPPPPPPPQPPKLSVSVKGPELTIPGVADATQAFMNGQPPPPGTQQMPPPDPNAPPQGPQGGPMQPPGDPMIPQSNGPSPTGPQPMGGTGIQPQQYPIQ